MVCNNRTYKEKKLTWWEYCPQGEQESQTGRFLPRIAPFLMQNQKGLHFLRGRGPCSRWKTGVKFKFNIGIHLLLLLNSLSLISVPPPSFYNENNKANFLKGVLKSAKTTVTTSFDKEFCFTVQCKRNGNSYEKT